MQRGEQFAEVLACGERPQRSGPNVDRDIDEDRPQRGEDLAGAAGEESSSDPAGLVKPGSCSTCLARQEYERLTGDPPRVGANLLDGDALRAAVAGDHLELGVVGSVGGAVAHQQHDVRLGDLTEQAAGVGRGIDESRDLDAQLVPLASAAAQADAERADAGRCRCHVRGEPRRLGDGHSVRAGVGDEYGDPRL